MDDASLAIFVNRSAQAMRAIRPVEKRWAYLAQLHAGLVADLRARRLDRDLAGVHADMAIEAVLDALADRALRPRVPVGKVSSLRPRPFAVPPAISP